MSLVNSTSGKLWLRQINDPADQDLARRLLEKLVFVSATNFQKDLWSLIDSKFPAPATVAFYIERELDKVKPRWPYKRPDGRPHRMSRRCIAQPMYQQVQTKRGAGLPPRWTAQGSGLPAVKSPTNLRQDIGSEGVVATIISKLCKVRGKRFALQPHTNDLAKGRASTLVIVTDFIGSGKRSYDMLDSLWRVATIRSWHSSGYRKLAVVAYSGTQAGIKKVQGHPCRPDVHIALKCLTVAAAFSAPSRAQVVDLCGRIPERSKSPLGFLNTGALIAFEHSCPNNVPAMFVESGRYQGRAWQPLFPSRTTVQLDQGDAAAREPHADALESLRLGGIAKNEAFLASNQSQQDVVTLLAAVYRGRRETADLVAASCLPFARVTSAFDEALRGHLLTTSGRLTHKGHALISAMNRGASAFAPSHRAPDPYYYPSSLRAPL